MFITFNLLERLEEGNVDFVFDMTYDDKEILIERIRDKKENQKIIQGFLPKLREKMPSFCLSVIYDMEEYKDEVFSILRKHSEGDLFRFLDTYKLLNILKKTSWGKKLFENHLDAIMNYNGNVENILPCILKIVLCNIEEYQVIIKKLYLHKNLHIRGLFMNYLVQYHYDKINLIYDDITKYLTSYTHQEFEQMCIFPNLMSFSDVSKMAVHFLEHGDKKMYDKLKSYLLNHYAENDLAHYLLDAQKEETKIEFLANIDEYFATSHDYQFYIYENYSANLSQEILEKFKTFLSYFNGENDELKYSDMPNIFDQGLGRKLQEYVDKYLSLSKRCDAKYIKSGSTCSCYRIGDYAFKLSRGKWSYEDVICPNLYIILKNLEEDFIRRKDGQVLAGLEIQKFLSKSIWDYPEDVRKEIVAFLESELKRLGYYNTDTIINGRCGDNCMLLDSYLDADAPNLKLLPPFFKKYPAVYIDRDRFYKLSNTHPKQLGEY